MPLKLFAVLFCFCCLSACGDEQKSQSQYDIGDEFTYSVLMYDVNNSLMLSILGAQDRLPNSNAQIEAIGQQNPNAVIDATLRLSLLKGHLNMLEVKQKTIAGIKQEQISVLKSNMSLGQFENVMSYYLQQIKAVRNNLTQNGNLSLYDAMIDAYIFNPKIVSQDFSKEYPAPMVDMARQIAVSRMDNQQWHQDIWACVAKYPEAEQGKNISGCTKDYVATVSKEMEKVLPELWEYRTQFEKEHAAAFDNENAKASPSEK